MTDEVTGMLQRGLQEWWNEETEHVLQRIERWAAFARGYNRLRSQRVSRGRLTMTGQEPRWTVSSNKLIIGDASWSPQFHALKRSRRKSRPEETRINCCGTFSYQSNANLDNNCLESYRYDHSIYFKTIGDIRNSKKNQVSPSEDLVQWDVDFIANQLLDDGLTGDNLQSIFGNTNGQDTDWFNVDLAKLDLNEEDVDEINAKNNNTSVLRITDESNNNRDEDFIGTVNLKNQQNILNGELQDVQDKHHSTKGCLDVRKFRRPSRKIKQSPIIANNDVVWPSVILNYTTNIDHPNSSQKIHHYGQVYK